MARPAPIDNGSIQGDTTHDLVGNAAANTWVIAATANQFAVAIANL